MNKPVDLRNQPRVQVRLPEPSPNRLTIEAVLIGAIVAAGFINAAWHLFG